MKPELSIVVPCIRVDLWDRMYDSILRSTKRTFELIIISPYALTPKLQALKNVKYVKDFGSPMRCSNIGIMLAEGRFIYPTHSDDAVFIDNSLDNNIDFLLSMGDSIKNILVCKYSESQNFSAADRYQPDDYYKIVNAYPVNRSIVPDNWLIFNAALWHREYFETFGGWDCVYEACPLGHADLAIRAYRDGANVVLSPYPISQVDHGHADHRPIEVAQIGHDTPIFTAKYNQPLDNFPKHLSVFNWKNAETVWSKRFGA